MEFSSPKGIKKGIYMEKLKIEPYQSPIDAFALDMAYRNREKINELIDEVGKFELTTVGELNAQGKYISQLLIENAKLREAVKLIAAQVDYISGGHNLGVTRDDEHYIEIFTSVNQILNPNKE